MDFSFGFDDADDTSMSMQDMYQEFILETSRSPHGFVSQLDVSEGALVGKRNVSHCFVGQSHQFNVTCGDEVTVEVSLDPDTHTIQSFEWSGNGCAISIASLSVLHDLVVGKTLSEFLELYTVFHQLMDSRGCGLSEEQMNKLDDASVFQGVSQFPMRIKCALLGWEAVKDALNHAE